ncbi:MAG: protein kinase [Chloroflexi bacterium]|nr:protein kinase [Chloroflexota bacterium]
MSTPPPGSYGDSLVGRTLNGVYRLVDLIGTGGFADVYLARDLRTNVTVAVKILHAHVAREAGLVQRFATEADVARRLQGPNVARALDSGQEAGIPPYLVMEYVQGLPLSEIIRRRGQMPVQEAVRLIDQALAALSEAHGLGIVHRDIKPANLMVDANGVVKVMDFGIARVLEQSGNTTVGHVLGTPAYMAPEQVAGQSVDFRTDLYAVGVVLYELLAGRSPFSGTSDPMVAMARVMNEAPTPVLSVRNDVPPGVAAVVDRALAKAPDWRFQSANEMRQALSQAMTPPTVQLPPRPQWPRTPPGGPAGPFAPPLPPYGTPRPPGPPGQTTPGPVQPGTFPPGTIPQGPRPPAPGGMTPGPGQRGPVPPMPPGPPYGGAPPRKSPLPVILGAGAIILLLIGGIVGLVSSGGIGGRGTATPTPTLVALAATSTPAAKPNPTNTPVPATAAAPTATPAPAKPTAPPQPTAAPATPVPPTAAPPTRVPPTQVAVAPTATALPRAVFQANFNNGDPRGLYIGIPPDRQREHLLWEGEYVIKTLVTQPVNSIAFIPNSANVADGVIVATVRAIDGADYAYLTLGCRAQNSEQVSQYAVQLTVSPPAVRLRRFDNGQPVALVDWVEHAAIRGGRQANRLELRCQGNTIVAVVNGVPVITHQDGRYQVGTWSMGTGTFGDMAGRSEGRFDDVELRSR